MIEACTTDGRIVVKGRLPDGAVAFVDADWIPPRGGAIAALLVLPDGAASWTVTPSFHLRIEASPDAVAGMIFDDLVTDVAAAVEGIPADLIQVHGRGLVSTWIRARLKLDASPSHAPPPRPRALIETTGDPAAMMDALGAVEDLGLVVLAGGIGATAMAIDLYPDVHARGLRLVGVPPPVDRNGSRQTRQADSLADVAQRIRDVANPARLNMPLEPDALLYRLTL